MVCGCCCNGEEKEPEGAWLKQDGRWCTDFIFLIAFIASFGLTYMVIALAQAAGGDPNKIVKPVNWEGYICGQENYADDGVTVTKDLTSTPYGAWPDPSTKYDLVVCVASCDETKAVDGSSKPTASGGHWIAPYESLPVFNWCIPDLAAAAAAVPAAATTADSTATSPSGSGLSMGDVGSWASSFTDAMGDLINAAGAIGISAGLSIVICFITVWLVGKFVKCLVYSLLGAVIVFGLVLGFLIWDYGLKCPDNYPDCTLTADEQLYAQYTGYTLWGITALFFIIMFALRKRVQIAIEVVSESAHAIQDMPLIMLFPFIPVCILLGYVAFWVWGATVIAGVTVPTKMTLENTHQFFYGATSGGDPWKNAWGADSVTEYTTLGFDMTYQYHAAWHFFHFLWVFQFFIYFCYLVFAGATADWYFTYCDDDGNKIRGNDKWELPNSPILSSCKRSMLHHIGTVALTSLIIAIIQFIRALVHYIEQQTKGDPPNQLQALIFKCIHCCLWLLECCMDKINKNALIWTAIWGDGFCTAACSSFQLLWANIGRVTAINVVAHLIVAVSKWFVAMATASVGVLIILYVDPYKSNVSSPVMPGVMIFLIGYFVGHMFFSVFNAVIDCVFLCFLVDDKFNKASDGGGDSVKMFASKALRELVDKYAEQSKEEGDDHVKKIERRPTRKGKKVAANNDDDYKEEEEEVEMTSKKKKKKKKKGSDE